MTKRTTAAEFASAWRSASGCPETVAKKLGINLRNVYSRRNAVEKQLGITLPSANNDRTGRLGADENLPKRGIRREAKVTGTVIVFSDAHFWPGMKTTAFHALLKLIKELKPAMVVCNGDAFDGARISRHDPIGWENRAYPLPKVPEEVEAVREAMDEIRAAYRGAKHVWNLGNHDIRLARYLAINASEVEGLKGTSLDDHVRHWDIGWSLMLNGNTMIKHRYNNGIHATYNNTLRAGTSMVTGHLHRLNVTAWGDYNGRRYGVDTGTLLDVGPDVPQTFYAEDNPAPHGSGFAVLNYEKSGMLLPPELVECINGHAYFRGRRV
jgi:hypothetical protein